MSKCHVRELSKVFVALFRDATIAFPTLRTEFESDLTRLQGLVEHRGIRVYLLDLPAVGKHLDRCLTNGQYSLSGLPLTKRYSNRVVIPKFLRGLYLLIFNESGSLKENYNVEAVVFLRQILFVAKKATFNCSPEAVEDEVLNFYETDKSLPEPERFWESTDSGRPDVFEETLETYEGFKKSPIYTERLELRDSRERIQLSILLVALDKVSNAIASALGSYDPGDWKFRHGPGAVSERTGPSNKFYWTNWSSTLEHEYPIADYGFHSYASWADRCYHDESLGSEDPYSRMVAVPKSFAKPRLIAAESSENQWCQQNLRHYFYTRSKDCWIGKFVRFNDQTLNQQLCTKGSSEGTLATLDLSEASDRVTCHAVGQLFRGNPKLLSCLRACRTQYVKQNLTPRAPELYKLRKFSTMGNACTFPVESLMFLSVAIAAVLSHRRLRVTTRNIEALQGEVAVFGDDIVIPTDCRESFCAALEVLHFKVNTAKSFWTGGFRESCGIDSYHGVDVTPVYWKQSYDGGPESLESVVESTNNFYMKFYVLTAQQLSSTLPWGLPEVSMRSGVTGLKTRTEPRSFAARRWNEGLQRHEVRLLTITSKEKRLGISNDSALLQCFTEGREPFVKWSSGYSQRPKTQVRFRWVPTQDLVTQPS
jgi:hypothetical protein